MRCSSCGTENKTGAFFCEKCGAALKAQNQKEALERRRQIIIGAVLLLIVAVCIICFSLHSHSQERELQTSSGVLENEDNDYAEDDGYNANAEGSNAIDNSTKEYELIGNWAALDEDDDPVELQFVSEDKVYIKTGIGWSAEEFEEYSYRIQGDEFVFEKENGVATIPFKLSENSYGGTYSQFLTLDYDEDNRVIYERVEE